MSSSPVQLSGGAFQDAEGNVLADGYLTFELSQDAQANSVDQICSGSIIKILLDDDGNIQSSPAQYMWPNDVLTPSGTFYVVSGYTAAGQRVWGPNAQQVLSTSNPYDVGGWTPGATGGTSNSPVSTYDILMFLQGLYNANQIVILLQLERQVRFLTNFSPSTATIGTNPTSTVTFTINKNGGSVGTVSINTSGSATFSGSAVVFNAGDILSVIAPGTTDATAANVSILLSGLVTGA